MELLRVIKLPVLLFILYIFFLSNFQSIHCKDETQVDNFKRYKEENIDEIKKIIQLECNTKFKIFIQEQWRNLQKSEKFNSKDVAKKKSFSYNLPLDDLIKWKNSTNSNETFLCSMNNHSFYVYDSPLYYWIGYISALASNNRIVGHIFEENYRRAQQPFFKGIRRESPFIRLLTSPASFLNDTKSIGNDRESKKNEFSNLLYNLAEKHMGAGSDILFVQLDKLNHLKKIVEYTNTTNQKHAIWHHNLKDIPIEGSKVILRVEVDLNLLLKDLLNEIYSIVNYSNINNKYEVGINRIYNSNEIFKIEIFEGLDKELREEARKAWKYFSNLNSKESIDNEDMKKDFESTKYTGFEFI